MGSKPVQTNLELAGYKTAVAPIPPIPNRPVRQRPSSSNCQLANAVTLMVAAQFGHSGGSST